MKKYSLMVVGLVLAAFLAVSCGSTPEPVEQQPEEPAKTDSMSAPVVPVVPEPKDEFQKAQELKQAIEKFGLSFALPDEYNKANDEFAAGSSAMGKDNAQAKALLVSAADRYQAVIDAAVAQGTEVRKRELQAAKAEADGVRAARAASEEYAQGEARSADAFRLLGEKKYEEAYYASEDAIAAYGKSVTTARERRAIADEQLRRAASAQSSAESRLEEVSKEIERGGAR